MNITKSVLALGLAAIVLTGCKKNTENTVAEPTVATEKTEAAATKAVSGQVEKVSFTVKGMSCAVMCASKIEKELAAMEGVQSAKVDFEKETATVEFDNAAQSPEKLMEKVESVADGKTYKASNLKTL